jgi:HTH-type transcriptional regulator/antitoxin HipB
VIAYKYKIYANADIDYLYVIAYYFSMDLIARSTKQLGTVIRRYRRQKDLTQAALGKRMNSRQATVSKLEAGQPATQLQVLIDALGALDLELVVRPRTTVTAKEIEDLF